MPILDFSRGCGDNLIGLFNTLIVPLKPVSFEQI